MTTQAEQIDNMINSLQEDLNANATPTPTTSKPPTAELIDAQIKSIEESLPATQTEPIDAYIGTLQEDGLTIAIEKERKFIKSLENEIQKSLTYISELEKIKMKKELRKEIEEELETIHHQARIDMSKMLEEESMKFAGNYGKELMKIFFDQ